MILWWPTTLYRHGKLSLSTFVFFYYFFFIIFASLNHKRILKQLQSRFSFVLFCFVFVWRGWGMEVIVIPYILHNLIRESTYWATWLNLWLPVMGLLGKMTQLKKADVVFITFVCFDMRFIFGLTAIKLSAWHVYKTVFLPRSFNLLLFWNSKLFSKRYSHKDICELFQECRSPAICHLGNAGREGINTLQARVFFLFFLQIKPDLILVIRKIIRYIFLIFPDLSTAGKVKRVLWDYIGKIVLLLGFLYLFICSLDFLSNAFRLIGGINISPGR